MCGSPRSSAPRSSFVSAFLSAPPCILSERTVATSTAASGFSPPARHLMSKNFSAPRSEPNPASVTTTSASASAERVARIELQPCAMLPNGPACTNAGPPSSVCTRFGRIASLSNIAIAPEALRSRARTGALFLPAVDPTMMRPSRSSRSARLVESATIAMISLAGMMTQCSSRTTPSVAPPSPITAFRSARSFMSMVRGQVMRRESSPVGFPC